MHLAALDPSFVRFHPPNGRERIESVVGAQGVLFQCPKCAEGKPPGEPDGVGFAGAHYVLCWFKGVGVPDDATPGPGRWNMTGDGFDNLTLSPSVHLTGEGCGWHGHVTNGEATLG